MPTMISRKLARNGRRQPHDIRSSRGKQGHQRECAGGEQIADGDAERRKAAPEATMLWWRVLDQEDHRAAIFGAGSQSLYDAHRDQQRRRPVADLGIGRQQADQRGADADHQQRRHQDGFTPEAVAHDAEQDAAERPHHEADAEGQERQQGADHGIAFGKEQLAEHQCGGGAVQEEVVPFERGPNTGRQDHAQTRAIVSLGCDLRHRFPRFDFLSSCLIVVSVVSSAPVHGTGAFASFRPRG